MSLQSPSTNSSMNPSYSTDNRSLMLNGNSHSQSNTFSYLNAIIYTRLYRSRTKSCDIGRLGSIPWLTKDKADPGNFYAYLKKKLPNLLRFVGFLDVKNNYARLKTLIPLPRLRAPYLLKAIIARWTKAEGPGHVGKRFYGVQLRVWCIRNMTDDYIVEVVDD